MALPQNIVPKLLIPFFQSGVMTQLINLAEKFGIGLNLFNAIRAAWPRDPLLPSDTYNSLVGWITSFVGRAVAAGDYLNSLLNQFAIDTAIIPKNFFLRHPADSNCDTWVSVGYSTMDTETGSLFENVGNFFIPAQTTKQGVINAIKERVNRDLEAIAAQNNRDELYQIIPGSIQLRAAVRLC